MPDPNRVPRRIGDELIMADHVDGLVAGAGWHELPPLDDPKAEKARELAEAQAAEAETSPDDGTVSEVVEKPSRLPRVVLQAASLIKKLLQEPAEPHQRWDGPTSY